MRPNKFTKDYHPSCLICYWYVPAYGCNYDPDSFDNIETFRGQRPACSKFINWTGDIYESLPTEHAEHWQYIDKRLDAELLGETNDTKSLVTGDNTPN